MVKAIIFDMDGVLIDSEPIHLKLDQQTFRKLGLTITDSEHWSYIGTTSHFMWESLKKRYDLLHTVEELVSIDRSTYSQYLLSMEEDLVPIKGVLQLIEMLKENKLQLSIASSSPINIINIVVKRLKLENYFDVLVSGDQVQRSKPEPDIFLYAAEKMGVRPKDCLVIEDSSNGVEAAQNANMKSIGFINLSSGKQDLSKADLVINSFSEITMEKLFLIKR